MTSGSEQPVARRTTGSSAGQAAVRASQGALNHDRLAAGEPVDPADMYATSA
jgi:hypothetical protein